MRKGTTGGPSILFFLYAPAWHQCDSVRVADLPQVGQREAGQAGERYDQHVPQHGGPFNLPCRSTGNPYKTRNPFTGEFVLGVPVLGFITCMTQLDFAWHGCEGDAGKSASRWLVGSRQRCDSVKSLLYPERRTCRIRTSPTSLIGHGSQGLNQEHVKSGASGCKTPPTDEGAAHQAHMLIMPTSFLLPCVFLYFRS